MVETRQLNPSEIAVIQQIMNEQSLSVADLTEALAKAIRLQAEVEALHRERIGEVWYWQGDGDDHLESTTCPVLIEADELKLIVDKAEKLDCYNQYRENGIPSMGSDD